MHQIWAGTYHAVAVFGKYPKSNISPSRYVLDMQKLYSEKLFTDLMITLGSDKYELHRVVVQALAPQMLEGDNVIHQDNVTTINLDATVVEKAVLELFIQYLYCFSIDVPTTVASKLEKLASTYHITHLEETIKLKLKRTSSGA